MSDKEDEKQRETENETFYMWPKFQTNRFQDERSIL